MTKRMRDDQKGERPRRVPSFFVIPAQAGIQC
jgi:hypothetical protein